MEKIYGLSHQEVLRLREKHGRNVIDENDEIFWVTILTRQFESPLIYILVIVCALSVLLREYTDAGLSFVVLLTNVLMGFYQEFTAQKALKALKNMLKPQTQVMRDGKKINIDISELVPEDIIVLNLGDKVGADGQLIDAHKMLVNESILTGEEEAVAKYSADRIMMGSTIVAGKGLLKVEKTGNQTEMGKIGISLNEIEDTKTPLQLKLAKLIKSLVWIVLSISSFIFIIGLLYREDFWTMVRMSTALMVAAFPEGLPIALTVILALGMRRILKRHGLIRKLLAIETLGATTVICTDKTGTLTEGNMRVVEVDTKNEDETLVALTLLNEQRSNLEVALLDYVKSLKRFDEQKLFESSKRLEEEPFDSEKKYSLSVNEVKGRKKAYIQGAPEIILSFCDGSEVEKERIIDMVEKWADRGLRLLGVASKDTGALIEKKNFKWLALIGIQDPVRAEAKETIAIAQKAGIKVKIITGDYRKTAEAVARNLGFKFTHENIMEGHELEIISDRELKNRIEKIVIFSRVLPHQKLKIVQALQEKGEIVAMTGDGVNDASALKKADMGIVVGSASEVAKEASDLVLLDSNFKTIISACEEGRLITSNVKKVVGYVLSNSFTEIVLIFGALLLKFPVPLMVVQILWIQLICNGPPDILLGFEPKEAGIMSENPKSLLRKELLSRPMIFLIFAISLTTGLCSLGLFWYYRNITGDIDLARTVAFATVAAVSMVYIFSFKNLQQSVFQMENLFTNKLLYLGVAYGFGLIFLAIYLPFFNNILKTVPLGWNHWVGVIVVSAITTFWVEFVKYLNRKKKTTI